MKVENICSKCGHPIYINVRQQWQAETLGAKNNTLAQCNQCAPTSKWLRDLTRAKSL